MKGLVYSVCYLFCLSAFAQTTMNCQSVVPRTPAVTLHLDRAGMFEKIFWDGEEAFSVNLTRDDHNLYLDVKDQLKDYPLALELQRYAIGRKKFHSVRAVINTSAKSTDPDDRRKVSFKDQMDILSDDAAGILHLTFLNLQGKSIGSSIMVGWAGFFKNCR
jgi:hypothetical protein